MLYGKVVFVGLFIPSTVSAVGKGIPEGPKKIIVYHDICSLKVMFCDL
jgi:hypothetical protein